MLSDLTGWLDEATDNLNSGQTIGNDPIKIKALLAKHKVGHFSSYEKRYSSNIYRLTLSLILVNYRIYFDEK